MRYGSMVENLHVTDEKWSTLSGAHPKPPGSHGIERDQPCL